MIAIYKLFWFSDNLLRSRYLIIFPKIIKYCNPTFTNVKIFTERSWPGINHSITCNNKWLYLLINLTSQIIIIGIDCRTCLFFPQLELFEFLDCAGDFDSKYDFIIDWKRILEIPYSYSLNPFFFFILKIFFLKSIKWRSNIHSSCMFTF